MEYLVRLAQAHETFRKPELEALASYERVDINILEYRPESPFCVLTFNHDKTSRKSSEETAKSFASRSILTRGMYELWGSGTTYELLHEDIRARTADLWPHYNQTTFKFSVHCFCGKRSSSEQRAIIDSFRYLGFQGKISMKDPEVEFVVFEEYEADPEPEHGSLEVPALETNSKPERKGPKRLFFGRYIGDSRRRLIEKHDLKKRPYISTTSMDAELALITANLALAAPGKIFLDPFVGTGGFMVAASELGALTFGCDIDGRSYRGKGTGLQKGVGANFEKYGLIPMFGDCFTSDLTNTPLRCQGTDSHGSKRWLDGIISDPPYGIREGLKVLGTRQSKLSKTTGYANSDNIPKSGPTTPSIQPHYIDGVLAHTQPGYIAPKKPYSFTRMLDDILDFAARTLVDGGRLAFWMPSANEHDQELSLPTHPALQLKHVCVQVFNKWSRRLLIYERLKGDILQSAESVRNGNGIRYSNVSSNADELNPFRKMYFKGFQS